MATLDALQAWLPAAQHIGDGATAFQRVHTDTRTLRPGDLFVALAGERFDATDFLSQASERGAVAAIAHRGLAEAGLPGYEVTDTLAALGAMARGWRDQFDGPLIAVTGSNGKTTVTQMIASILRADCGEAALATEGNFNNEIGLPLTLLRLNDRHRKAVVELGMNHIGEIARLGAIARPTVALVNNAQREHQEFMVSVESVARENGAVLAALRDGGTAVFPANDAFAPLWRDMVAASGPTRRCITFSDDHTGASEPASVFTTSAVWQGDHWQLSIATPAGPVDCELHIAGRHNLRNALAATACAIAAGVPVDAIGSGLSDFRPVSGRFGSRRMQWPDGRVLTLIDDSYNANPDSVRAAIDVLAAMEAPRLLVFGDMAEVGERSVEFHREIGAYARDRGIDGLFALGTDSVHSARAFFESGEAGDASTSDARHFNDIDSLNEALCAWLPGGASLLVKGSRSMKMERAVAAADAAWAAALSESAAPGGAPC